MGDKVGGSPHREESVREEEDGVGRRGRVAARAPRALGAELVPEQRGKRKKLRTASNTDGQGWVPQCALGVAVGGTPEVPDQPSPEVKRERGWRGFLIPVSRGLNLVLFGEVAQKVEEGRPDLSHLPQPVAHRRSAGRPPRSGLRGHSGARVEPERNAPPELTTGPALGVDAGVRMGRAGWVESIFR